MLHNRLFVYGTLRSSCNHPMHRKLLRNASLLGNASLSGRLYDLGNYPGLIPGSNARYTVQGELYQLVNPGLLLATLDRYEGCHSRASGPPEYRREILEVNDHSGESCMAWVYVYNWPVKKQQLIRSGDYLIRRSRSVCEARPAP